MGYIIRDFYLAVSPFFTPFPISRPRRNLSPRARTYIRISQQRRYCAIFRKYVVKMDRKEFYCWYKTSKVEKVQNFGKNRTLKLAEFWHLALRANLHVTEI